MKKILALLLFCGVFCNSASAQYESYTAIAREDGVIVGDETGNFDEEKIASRGEFAVMLTKFLNLSGGINIFSDVKESDWFCDALSAAHHHGILMGSGQGMAMPYSPITRQEAITILGRYYKATADFSHITGEVSAYALPFWAYAEKNNLLLSDVPYEFVSKGEILKLIYDYDASIGESVRFLAGFPRISSTAEFGKISIDIKTNVPCTIYYKLAEVGSPAGKDEYILCNTQSKKVTTAAILANINKSYNVYLRAVSEAGTVKSISIDHIEPFAIAIGGGTEDDPYIVYTPLQLSQISLLKNAHFRLGANLTLPSNWNPVDDFSGIFDGNGYTITLEDGKDIREGVFGTLSGGTIRNLTVAGSVHSAKNGGLIAKINDGGLIESCAVTGKVEVRTDSAGGICGQNIGSVRNCLSAVYSVASGSFAGGIAGQNSGIIENCLSAVEVVASEMYAGGICGTNDGGTIKACVGANVTVYDSLTTNSGKLTTNRKGGSLENNYCYDGIISNALYEEPSAHSQNGFDVSWENICSSDFYRKLGWDMRLWSQKAGGYRLISPKKTAPIELIPGKTIYFPKSISTEQELREISKDSAGHYALSKDIVLTAPWKTLCPDGFSGTFDGCGYSVSGLTLRGESGMFSNITGGTVRNLILRNVQAFPTSAGAILTACNYGYIDNCRIYGKIESKKTGGLGTIAGENHGAITSCDVYADILSTNSNATIGGISAENDGNIVNCMYIGKVIVNGENAVIGGLCGYSTGGNIFESHASPTISFSGTSGYIGGACGIMSGTQGYKLSSAGSILTDTKKVVYSGGLCGLLENAVLYNGLSHTNLRAETTNGYSGGICGYASGSNVQNTYSAGTIVAFSEVATGGICGFGEGSFIMQNVALNPAINGGITVGSIVGDTDLCSVFDNYFVEKMLINGKHLADATGSGQEKTITALKNLDFYIRPISSGGLLGWESDVWQAPSGGYSFPILSGVKGQNLLRMPTYK